jgi:hypothetical protein
MASSSLSILANIFSNFLPMRKVALSASRLVESWSSSISYNSPHKLAKQNNIITLGKKKETYILVVFMLNLNLIELSTLFQDIHLCT